ncbi:cation-translocating P-type ATPase [Moraxella nasovis]|uniref:heavy metal translocating P-type ATPase n=1 Tax=Moraxella nasovis TaxID=2904121 RepID=UPI001F61EBE1|nr:cation-translocating P-type ATPase [Moraxella nasovis]UNU73483.1 cation-translocating P-type ATPase [Moraxella nasovis]
MATHEQSFKIDGMSCAACATRIEKVLNKKAGVTQALVNFASETASIQADGVSDEQICEWIKKAGYQAKPINDNHTDETLGTATKAPWEILALAVLSLPFWVGMLGMMVGSHALMPPIWVQFILATIVQFGFGWRFYKGAYDSLKGGLANMDVLVALGTSVIWLYSLYVWQWADGHHVYFEASVMVILFISLGKFLEMRTKKQSLDSMALLMELLPSTVSVKVGDSWKERSIDTLNIGDVLLGRMGDKIAVDGTITKGVGITNEAHLTGESRAITKQQGDTVLAGSVIMDGSFEYQATAMGRDTALGDVMSALQAAYGSKANIARLADKVAGVFVPAVVVIALLVFVANYLWLSQFDAALMRAVAVLVVACPCALGLATPVAIMAGMGVATSHGVQFKDAPSLELAGSIDMMAFDKTGTLTLGKPSIRSIHLFDKSKTGDEVLGIAASLEQHANHPLATSIVQAAKDKAIELYTVTHANNLVGQGVVGEIMGVGVVKVGSPKFVNAKDFEQVLEGLITQENFWDSASIVMVAINDTLIAMIAMTDELDQHAKAVIKKLEAEQVSVAILSGDKQSVADDVAGELGIMHVFGGLSPTDKAKKVASLKQQYRVAMIGDGVNDTPAMKMASVSFAMGEGTDVAKHSANAILAGKSIAHAYYAYKIAKLTLKNIKQNLFFAFIYNIVGIGFAAVGVLTPIYAAAMMALSSISVLANALRLKRIKLNDF